VTDNSAPGGDGGGLFVYSGSATLTGCTVSGNSAAGGGGLYVGSDSSFASATLTGCTISGNSAAGAGGLDNDGTLWLTNTTVVGNVSNFPFGGGGLVNDGTLWVTNSTIAGNSSTAGAGLNIESGAATLTNTIVANNSPGDIQGTLDSNSANNLVGDGSGLTGIENGSQGNQVGTAPAPIDPLLAPLGDYGGPTQTRALLPGSPAIGVGTADGAPTKDQRNELRTGHVDIGAFQSKGFTLTPAAGSTPQPAAVGKAFKNPLAVTVKANNPVEPVDGGVISFAAPAGGASATLSADKATITATEAGDVASVTATANSRIGGYAVSARATGAGPANFNLANIKGSDVGRPHRRDGVLEFDDLSSLRAAIAYANSHSGPDTITFDPAASDARHRTIRVTGGPLVLTDPATSKIIGPGARRLTFSGGGKSRVFDIEGGSLALDGVTITGGNADRGGGILIDRGRLSLTDVVIRDNRANMGGGLYNDGRTTFSRVLIEGNHARVGPEMFNTRAATLFWRGSQAKWQFVIRGAKLRPSRLGAGI
jgi:hypothetical protein